MPRAVLVLEKDPLTRETIVYMLKAMKYNVIAFERAEDAVGLFTAVAFDVIVISLDADDPDGNTLAMVAKRLQRDIKAIVVSGRHPPDVLKPYVDAFVQKPFSLHDIDNAISRVLQPDDWLRCSNSLSRASVLSKR